MMYLQVVTTINTAFRKSFLRGWEANGEKELQSLIATFRKEDIRQMRYFY